MTKLKTILGNATRSGFHKPRGAMTNYHPHKDTAELFEQVQDVLDEYEDYLPMTLRQVFYRLVGAHGFPKTDKAYARLSENLNKARRAGIIAWSAIRDDKGQGSIAPLGYDDAADFMVTLRRRAERFRLDRQQDQEVKLVIACEAAGMVPQLERVADEYGVPVITGGGFDSTTRRYDLAEAISEEDRLIARSACCISAIMTSTAGMSSSPLARMSKLTWKILAVTRRSLDWPSRLSRSRSSACRWHRQT
jgi:hypothetical protein